jgi:hypothetical protein
MLSNASISLRASSEGHIAMNIVSTSAASGQGTHERSVQTYIDETPVWADGTTVQSTPLTAMQWRIWTLATAGKFFEGLVVFMTGVALPLIAQEFGFFKTRPASRVCLIKQNWAPRERLAQ